MHRIQYGTNPCRPEFISGRTRACLAAHLFSKETQWANYAIPPLVWIIPFSLVFPCYTVLMSSRTKALLAMTLATLLWSTAGLSKILVLALDPFTAGFLRFFVASLVVLPFFLREKRKRGTFADLIPVGIFSTVNVALYFWGLSLSTANAAAIIYSAMPLVVAILAKRIIKENVTPKKLLGILIGFTGALFVVVLPLLEKGAVVSGNPFGNVLFAVAVLAWSSYTITSRQALNRGYSPLSVSAVSILTSCAVFFFLALPHYSPLYVSVILQPAMFLLLLHISILVTVGTFFLYQWALQHSSATTVSLYIYFLPPISVVINVIFLGEKITTGFVIGSALVLLGVFLATGSNLTSEVRSWFRRR